MLNRENIVATLKKVLLPHVPRNSRGFKYRVFDGIPDNRNSLGFIIDPVPCEGKVIEILDDFFLVKIKRTAFCVVAKSLATCLPSVGDTVRITPYARRHFDGQRIDAPTKETRTLPDGTEFTTETRVLGGETTRLPVAEPKCPELAALKQQIEIMPAPDGFRTVAHLLVDANAQQFSMLDPAPDEIIRTPPTIRCHVKTTRFEGWLSIIYDRAMDTYVIEFHQADQRIERIDDVYFDDLGQRLADRIDDGLWRQIKVDILKSKAAQHLHS